MLFRCVWWDSYWQAIDNRSQAQLVRTTNAHITPRQFIILFIFFDFFLYFLFWFHYRSLSMGYSNAVDVCAVCLCVSTWKNDKEKTAVAKCCQVKVVKTSSLIYVSFVTSFFFTVFFFSSKYFKILFYYFRGKTGAKRNRTEHHNRSERSYGGILRQMCVCVWVCAVLLFCTDWMFLNALCNERSRAPTDWILAEWMLMVFWFVVHCTVRMCTRHIIYALEQCINA